MAVTIGFVETSGTWPTWNTSGFETPRRVTSRISRSPGRGVGRDGDFDQHQRGDGRGGRRRHVFVSPLLDLVDQFRRRFLLDSAERAFVGRRRAVRRRFRHHGLVVHLRQAGCGRRPTVSVASARAACSLSNCISMAVQPPIVLGHPGGDARAGDEHLVDIVQSLAAQPDLEGGALLAAGRIDEADVGPGLGEGRGREPSRRIVPAGSANPKAEVRRPKQVRSSKPEGSNYAGIWS